MMMLPIVSGTIRSTVKLAEMDSKWQQKKKSNKIFDKENADPVARQIQRYKEDMEKMRESKKMGDISAKLKSGGTLSSEEIEYLKRNNPQMYQNYIEIQNEKKAYERELKACRTKEDVEELKFTKMSSLMAEAKSIVNNPYIPEGKKLGLMEKILGKTMGVQKVHMEFLQSDFYRNLPTEEEVAEEEKAKAEQSEETSEEVKEAVQEDQEFIDDLQEENKGTETEMIKPEDTGGSQQQESKAIETSRKNDKVKLPELKKNGNSSYEEAKAFVINYIKNNRPNGYGLEFLKDDFDQTKKHG